jgi:DNA-binding winged-HTH domains
MSTRSQHLYEFGPYRLDTAEQLLLRDGKPVPLTPKVFETLVALVERSGHLVEKEELMKLVWSDVAVEESNLTNNVAAIRKLLGQGKSGPSYIETVPKRGYRFTAPVKELPPETLVVEKRTVTRVVTEETEEETQNEKVASAIESAPIIRTVTVTPNSARRSNWLVMAVILVVGSASAYGIYWLIARSQARNRASASVPFSAMAISRVTSSGKSKHAAISPDGKYIAHVTEDAEGNSLWIRHVTAPSDVRLSGPAESEYLWVAFAPDGNSIYYITLDRDKGDTGLYRIPVLGGPSAMAGYDLWPVGFSPNRKEMAFIKMDIGETSYLMIANADSTNQRILAGRKKPDFFRGEWNAPAWSPDGKSIACPVRLTDDKGEFETILGINVKDGSQTPLTTMRWSSVGQPAWLADGTGLLLTARERSTGPSQVWHIAVKSGDATRVTHDLNDYHDLSLTQDSSRLAVVQDQAVSNMWVARDGDAASARQIVSEIGPINLLAWTRDGRIVYHSNAGESSEIWVTNADGTMRRQLTVDARVSDGLTVSPDDLYIFFVSDRAGHFNIWRVDADGQNLKQVTTGEGEFFPECSPDGEWLIYQQGYYEPRLWKMRIDGSSRVQLTVTRGNRPAVSADGQTIAYHYLDPELEKSQWSIGIVSSNGGQRLRRFNLPPTVGVTRKFVRWFPDQKSIAYVNKPGGLSDIWLQPIDGSQPKRLTEFKVEQMLAFDWSHDGRSLAFVREIETRDVVLIEQTQK